MCGTLEKFHTFLKKVGVTSTKTAKRIIAVPVYFLHCGCRASETQTIQMKSVAWRCHPDFFSFAFVSATVVRPQWSTCSTVPRQSRLTCGNGNQRLPATGRLLLWFLLLTLCGFCDWCGWIRSISTSLPPLPWSLFYCASGQVSVLPTQMYTFLEQIPELVCLLSRLYELRAPSPAAGLHWWTLISAGVGIVLPLNALSCRVKLGAEWLAAQQSTVTHLFTKMPCLSRFDDPTWLDIALNKSSYGTLDLCLRLWHRSSARGW